MARQSEEGAQPEIHGGIGGQIQLHKRVDKTRKLLLQLKETGIKLQETKITERAENIRVHIQPEQKPISYRVIDNMELIKLQEYQPTLQNILPAVVVNPTKK